MTKRTTLVIFYAGVTLICAAILGLVNFVIVPGLDVRGKTAEAFVNVGKREVRTWFPIGKDLEAVNQDGVRVKLSDLRGKVWVIAEFFAICPHCAVRNGTELRMIYEEFKNHPDFQMVCVSVDPRTDDIDKLEDYASALGAESRNWWFLNAGDENATHEYLEGTLKFFGIRERGNPEEIKENGRFMHDMGLIVVDRDFNVIGKWPLADARSEEGKKLNPGLYDKMKEEIFSTIRAELSKSGDAMN